MAGPLKLLDRALFLAIGIVMAAMVADVTIQIFFRYVIQDPPTWTEELARYLFVWDVFLAAGLAFGRGAHIVVDALLLMLPAGARRALSIFTNALVFAFLVVLVWQGIAMARLTSNTVSTALNLNMGVVYASLPVGAAISALYVLVRLIDEVRGVSPPVDPLQVMVD